MGGRGGGVGDKAGEGGVAEVHDTSLFRVSSSMEGAMAESECPTGPTPLEEGRNGGGLPDTGWGLGGGRLNISGTTRLDPPVLWTCREPFWRIFVK